MGPITTQIVGKKGLGGRERRLNSTLVGWLCWGGSKGEKKKKGGVGFLQSKMLHPRENKTETKKNSKNILRGGGPNKKLKKKTTVSSPGRLLGATCEGGGTNMPERGCLRKKKTKVGVLRYSGVPRYQTRVERRPLPENRKNGLSYQNLG